MLPKLKYEELDLMKEKLSNDEILEEQSHDSVAWEGDISNLIDLFFSFVSGSTTTFSSDINISWFY
uniref:Uncharacterized protein n=1 Tax=Solanum lycopersicum TaxID=4081 RepID=A0A3Q7IXZ6_SOLLC